MQIGAKLRELRLAKNLSQGDIQKRTVPSIGTLEKYAHALEIPLYRLFTDEVNVPKLREPSDDSSSWGTRGKEREALQTLAKALARMDEQDRKLLLSMAEGMARRGARGRGENKSSF